jgi:hypothetical protein
VHQAGLSGMTQKVKRQRENGRTIAQVEAKNGATEENFRKSFGKKKLKSWPEKSR